jgi:hypothetical protein
MANLFYPVWSQQRIQMFAPDRLTAWAFGGTVDIYVASLTPNYTIPLALSAVDTHEA